VSSKRHLESQESWKAGKSTKTPAKGIYFFFQKTVIIVID